MTLIIAEVDFVKLLPFAVFGAGAVVAWIVVEWIASRKTRSDHRLDEIRDPGARLRREEGGISGATNAMSKMLEKATPAMAKPLAPTSEKEVSKVVERLNHAGFRGETAVSVFYGLKFAGLIAGLFLSGGSMLLAPGFNLMALVRIGAFVGCGLFAPDIIVWFIGSKRKESIFLGLPDALDMIVVCVEAGLGLDQAMRKVSDELKKSYPTIANEFAICNMQLQMGRARAEVLHELGQRSGVEDLRQLASIIIQADKFGSSIAHALRVQSESMRTRRRQLAEERAQKTAVKLIFPLVIFIFPGIFVILVGPAAITMVNEMLPAMGGGG